jgi:hypothetical protein
LKSWTVIKYRNLKIKKYFLRNIEIDLCGNKKGHSENCLRVQKGSNFPQFAWKYLNGKEKVEFQANEGQHGY